MTDSDSQPIRNKREIVGWAAIIGSLVLPIAVNCSAKLWLAYLEAHDAIPNQGAMVVAFLAFLASIVVAAGTLGFGITMLIRSRRPSSLD